MSRKTLIAFGALLSVGLSGMSGATAVEPVVDQSPSSAQVLPLSDESKGGLENDVFVETLGYDLRLNRYTFDAATAIELGADPRSAHSVSRAVDEFTDEEVSLLNDALGSDPNRFRKTGRIQTRALPVVVVPVLKILGGGAAAAVSKAVVTWGLAGACERLKRRYGAFDSMCRANGWQ